MQKPLNSNTPLNSQNSTQSAPNSAQAHSNTPLNSNEVLNPQENSQTCTQENNANSNEPLNPQNEQASQNPARAVSPLAPQERAQENSNLKENLNSKTNSNEQAPSSTQENSQNSTQLNDTSTQENLNPQTLPAAPFRSFEAILKDAKAHILKREQEFEGSNYYIDKKLALKAVKFIAFLKHTDGELAGVHFQLLPFQIAFIIDIIATFKKHTHTRRYKYALLFIPRKNGKTELIGALLNYFLFMDSEKGKEIYCVANETEQASIIFRAASMMIKQEPFLRDKVSEYKTYRLIKNNASLYNDFIKVLTSKSDTKDGLRPYIFVYDELHAAKDNALYKVLEDGARSRSNYLALVISTAGFNLQSEMHRQYEYAKQVKAGIIKDESTYSMIFEPDEGDDWTDERTWQKVNPALNYGVKLEGLRQGFLRAKFSGNDEVSFKTKHLNIWTSAARAFVKDDDFMKCNLGALDLSGECFVGVDLSKTTDLTAIAYICEVKGVLHVKMSYFIPEINALERSRRDKVPYLDWHKKGLITLIDGNCIDQEFIFRDILEFSKSHKLVMTGYDRWNSSELSKRLNEENVECAGIGQGFKSLSEPLKEYESRILSQKINHAGNEILRWNNANLCVSVDASENIKPDKAKSSDRIDGISALVTAIATKNAILKPAVSIYEQRGIRTL